MIVIINHLGGQFALYAHTPQSAGSTSFRRLLAG